MLRWLKDTIYKMLFGFNIVAGLLLLCVYIAPFVPPSKLHWFAILAIGYPYLFFLNLLFAGWWLYKRKRYFYLSAIILIIGFQHFFNFFGLNFSASQLSPASICALFISSIFFIFSFYLNVFSTDQVSGDVL